MQKKELYMIGNSHIDPVWFWDWDEGMQEVKATFSSALDRMREYPDMKFTSTSSAFFEWIETIAPEMFAEIKERVAQGRWELTGGWFIEPDCILPCGEAFVRQGLYGQRYFEEKFGQICRTGSNVDSFGHNPALPQILKKSGMDEYVFMRPRLETPVFQWRSADGSKVNAVSLPSEYTTWFCESTKEAMEMALKAADSAGLHNMVCCYGVGNHGGGPTKQNIEAVQSLQADFAGRHNCAVSFGSFRQFFDSLTQEQQQALPVREGFFDKVNTGCYSMDGALKRHNRLAQERLKKADGMLVMERILTGTHNPLEGRMKELWKTLLFCQFHDTLGGTAIKAARDEAVRQLLGVCAECKKIWTLSMQNIANALDTTGRGFPLFLFNPDGAAYRGPVCVEINWFCKDGLTLLNPDGEEIAYQRTYTAAKARNYNLGGRRAIVFDAEIPAAGFAVYRTVPELPKKACDVRREPEFSLERNVCGEGDWNPYLLENDYIRARFGEAGFLESLRDKEQGYEALQGAVSFPVQIDERDSWGGRQEMRFEDSGEVLRFKKLETVESGCMRKVVRAVYESENGGSRLSQEYILYHDAREILVRNRLFWNQQWRMLHMQLPLASDRAAVLAECACGTVRHAEADGEERSMHRFLDVTQTGQAGLCIANDGKYTYVLRNNVLRLPLARSAIFAQGSGKNWYNPLEGYEYADIGSQEFCFLLRPHGQAISQKERYRMAGQLGIPYLSLADNVHGGAAQSGVCSAFWVEGCGVEPVWTKLAEDGDAVVIRLLETEGRDQEGTLHMLGNDVVFHIGHDAIETMKIDVHTGDVRRVNLLEKETM
ncbi:MAG: alpha-mannosidase [Lachnospiraceae bacterium]|nr:alpha-mannosidase [Lachnospiraceae bacterium]